MRDGELGWLVRELRALAGDLDEQGQSKGQSALVIAIDQGGHASRALAFDLQGNAVAESFTPITTYRSAPDRIEQDASEIIESIRTALDDLALTLGEEASRVVAVGLATQRSNVVCWDRRNAKALSPVLSWQDRRNASLVESLRAHAGQIRQTTGLVLSPHYGASKLKWCLDEIEGVHAARQAKRLGCGPLASYLLFALLEERPYVVDPANASRTQLWDPALRTWSKNLAALFGVPVELLPTSVRSRHDYGHISFGGRSLPLVICTGDQSAAPFAYGAFDAEAIYLNLGTGAFLQRAGDADDVRLLRSVTYMDEQHLISVQEGTVNGAGSALDWLNERIGIDAHRAALAMKRAHAGTPPLFINAVGGLGSPYWQPQLQSRFIGEGSEALQVQAVVESIAFLIARNVELMRAGATTTRILASGGLGGSDYLCECVASLTQLPVDRSSAREATALGLAFLTADQPAGWQPPTEFQRFAPERDDALRTRYERWLDEVVR
jgi:glycerol kinase